MYNPTEVLFVDGVVRNIKLIAKFSWRVVSEDVIFQFNEDALLKLSILGE